MNTATNLRNLMKNLYNIFLRKHLPRKLASLNGVPVRYIRLFDTTDVFPNYEQPLLACIRKYLASDSSVSIVGGGWGVSSVVAARVVRPVGSVTVFEAGIDQIEHIRETLVVNNLSEFIDVNHSVVGEPRSVWGEFGKAERISGKDLPSCDALILDCEGAEAKILPELNTHPETIIVETHSFLDAPEEEIRDILRDMGYEIVDRKPEDENRGIVILVAQYNRE